MEEKMGDEMGGEPDVGAVKMERRERVVVGKKDGEGFERGGGRWRRGGGGRRVCGG